MPRCRHDNQIELGNPIDLGVKDFTDETKGNHRAVVLDPTSHSTAHLDLAFLLQILLGSSCGWIGHLHTVTHLERTHIAHSRLHGPVTAESIMGDRVQAISGTKEVMLKAGLGLFSLNVFIFKKTKSLIRVPSQTCTISK